MASLVREPYLVIRSTCYPPVLVISECPEVQILEVGLNLLNELLMPGSTIEFASKTCVALLFNSTSRLRREINLPHGGLSRVESKGRCGGGGLLLLLLLPL